MTGRFSTWKLCPACRSYRFTWKPPHLEGGPYGKCQDCDYEGDGKALPGEWEPAGEATT